MSRLFAPAVALILFLGECGGAYATFKTVTLSVPDMDCPTCPIVLKKALSRVAGVSHVDVSLEKREVAVTFDDARATPDQLTNATAQAGFPSAVKGQ